MLNCTWDDLETKMVLSRLERPLEEQRKLQNFYQNLREEYRKRRRTVASVRVEPAAELNTLENALRTHWIAAESLEAALRYMRYRHDDFKIMEARFLDMIPLLSGSPLD